LGHGLASTLGRPVRPKALRFTTRRSHADPRVSRRGQAVWPV